MLLNIDVKADAQELNFEYDLPLIGLQPADDADLPREEPACDAHRVARLAVNALLHEPVTGEKLGNAAQLVSQFRRVRRCEHLRDPVADRWRHCRVSA